MEELINNFNSLGEKDKVEFIKKIMPYMAAIFKQNPQLMIEELMPICKKMMGSEGFNPQEMMKMMFK